MRFIREYEKREAKGEAYFMGGNTGNGFRGVHLEVFNEDKLQMLYIIKGASGCGKSRVMKCIADTSESEGHSVVRFLCGSDHKSLDGIIIDRKIAVCDGTSPHVMDMKYPGAASALVDLSKFWTQDKLIPRKSEIMHLSDVKRLCYSKAYNYLRSADILSAERIKAVTSCCNMEKIQRAADKLTGELPRESISCNSKVYTRNIGMTGMNRIGTLELAASHTVAVNDVYGSAYVFMEVLSNTLKNRGASQIVSVDPVVTDAICEIYLPKSGLLITTDNVDCSDREVNMTRFIDSAALASARGELRLNHKCDDLIIEETLKALTGAAEAHFAIERIYGEVMDFEGVSEYTEKLKSEILSRL